MIMLNRLKHLTRGNMLDYLLWLNERNFSPTKLNLGYWLAQNKQPKAKIVEEMFQPNESADLETNKSARQFE